MIIALHVMHLDGLGPVGDHLLVGHPFNHRRAWITRQLVRGDRRGVAQHLLVERLVHLVRQDRKPFGHHRAQAARMIRVLVRVDDVADRLRRHEPLHLRQHRLGALLVADRFDDHDEVAELHQEVVRNRALERPEARGDLLGRGARRPGGRRRRRTFGRRHRQRRGAVWLHAREGQFQDRKAALPLDDAHRILHAGDVAVIRVLRFQDHVAVERVGHGGLDPLDQVLVVDGAADREPVEGTEGHDALAALRAGTHGGVVRRRALQEPVRRQPDLEGAVLGPAVAHRVGRLRAERDRPDAALLGLRHVWSRASAPRRVLVVNAHRLLAHHRHAVVDQRVVFRDRETRPRPARPRRLAERVGIAAGG